MQINGKSSGFFAKDALYEKGDKDFYFYKNDSEISWYQITLKVLIGQNNFKSHVISEDEFNN